MSSWKSLRITKDNKQQSKNILRLYSMLEEAKIKELYARSVNLIASARERHGREQSNIGLLEERVSQIASNNSISTKNKVEALDKLMDVIAKHGEMEANLRMKLKS